MVGRHEETEAVQRCLPEVIQLLRGRAGFPILADWLLCLNQQLSCSTVSHKDTHGETHKKQAPAIPTQSPGPLGGAVWPSQGLGLWLKPELSSV